MTTTANKGDKAAAILAAEAQIEAANAAKLANYEAVRKAVLDKAHTYGAETAAGAMSLTKLAYLFNEAVRTGAMSEGDARNVYEAFAKGHNEVVEAKGTVEIDGVAYSAATDKEIDFSEKGNKVPVSMFRTFGKPAAVAQGLALYQRVLRCRVNVAKDDLYGSAYSCMVKVNREVVAASEKSDLPEADILAGKFEVTDEQITAWCSKSGGKEEPAKKSFADKLARLVDDARKLVKAGECDALRAVYDELVKVEAGFKLVGNAKPAAVVEMLKAA